MRLILALSALSFAALAVCLILPGALLPLLLERFQMRILEAGTLLAMQPVGHLAAVGIAPLAIRRYGLRATLRTAFLVAAVGYLGFGFATTWVLGTAAILTTGLGIGGVEVAANTLVIQRGGQRSNALLNLTHLFFGIASVIVPFAATRAVTAGWSWTAVCTATAGLVLLAGFAWRFLPPVEIVAANRMGTSTPLRWPFLLLLSGGMAVYVGAEMGIGSWLTEYMMSRHSVPLTTAGNVLSLYWLGLTTGRLILSLIAHRIADEQILFGLTAFATIAILFAQYAPTPGLSAIGFIGTGLGFSGIFPGLLAIGGRAHPEAPVKATSIVIAGAGSGQILLPWAMAALADRTGLVRGMLVYAGLCALLFLISITIRNRTTRRS